MYLRLAAAPLVFCAAITAQNQVDIRSGVFRGVPVTYRVIDGLAILEGDIILGTAQDLELASAAAPKSGASRGALLAPDPNLRWPNATIPYRIDPDIPNPQRVKDAVAYWNANTPIQLTPFAGETNSLRFIRQQNFGVCFSSIGMVGGEQTIRVDDACAAGLLIHEIGHTVGLYHEQSRIDRDRYVYVAIENVNKTLVGNFDYSFTAIEGGPYDYGSIMGYGRFDEQWNPYVATIETIPPGMPIGQRTSLSPEEIFIVQQMYGSAPGSTLVSSNPIGLTVLVDGAAVTTPQTFNWSAGDMHTLEAPGPQGDNTVRYVFGRWSDDGDAAHTITVGDGPAIYGASFIQQFPLKTSVVGNGTVTVDPPSDSGFYPTGSLIRITATPGDGSWFERWSGFFGTLEGPGRNPTTLRLTFTGANYVANFIPRQPTVVTTDPPGLPISIDGAPATSPQNLDWAAGSKHSIAVQTPIAPRAGLRYVFQKWSDGGALSHMVTAANPATYTATFATQYQLTTNAPTLGKIQMAPASADGFYNAGAIVQVTAVPNNNGIAFTNWSGDLTGTAPSQPIVMNSQEMVIGTFAGAGGLSFNASVHAATLQPEPGSPLQELAIYGLAIGPDPGVAATPGADPVTILGGTRVLFDGAPGQMLAAAANRILVLVPAGVAGNRTTSVQLEVNGKRSGTVVLGVLDTHPGLFTADGSGTGPALAFNDDGTPNAAANPDSSGSLVSLLVTGAGLTDDNGVPLAPVRVEIGGQDAEVDFTGPADGQPPGVIRIDARIPGGIPPGTVPVRVYCGSSPSPAGTTINVQ